MTQAGTALTAEQVSARTREVLAGCGRPDYVVFTEQLPKNPSGTILKKEVRLTYVAQGHCDG